MLILAARDYDAVLFDLDGVLTRTASVHAAAWKQLFDGFLHEHANRTGKPFVPFDIEGDYQLYVDGKPRQDGVASFLASRQIALPWDDFGRAPGLSDGLTIQELGRRKDAYFQALLAERGVQVYDGAIALVRELRARGVRTAVVSASNNCAAVMAAANIDHLFDTRVDGQDVSRLGLAGKPAPDAFVEAARRLDVEPDRAVVIEDALAGVAAGSAGGFGLVIGVDRGAGVEALLAAGASVVVDDLSEVSLATEPARGWLLEYDAFDPAREGMREALCTLGNGYFATRGAVPWSAANAVHYPGTYLACGYNRLYTEIDGVTVESEDLVNFPNWLGLQFRVEGGNWFDLCDTEIKSYRQQLDLRRGVLTRRVRFEDAQGRVTRLQERRLVSMSNMHLAAIELVLTAENWAGTVTLRSSMDGRLINAGAKLYRRFNSRHLEPVSQQAVDHESLSLVVRTNQSDVRVAQAARTRLFLGKSLLEPERRTLCEPGYVAQDISFRIEACQSVRVEKVLAFHTSRDAAISEAGLAACKALHRAPGFEQLLSRHSLAWKHLWRRFDVQLQPFGTGSRHDVLALLRLNMFHLLQTVSPHSIGLDIGVPARGWTGEAYQGHIFWDEIFIFPFFNLRLPEITRSLLLYRFRRLDEARAAAAGIGLKGAMFPWQSGSDGQEQTQKMNLNPHSGRWVPDNSYLQRHVGSAIVYNVWHYFQVSGDLDFMQSYGAELILEIAQFWSSMTHFSPQRRRYEIHGVMGPDEFHDAYPESDKPGLNNNAYTNIMAVWVFCRALDTLQALSAMDRLEVMQRVGVTPADIERWDDISRRMYVPFHDEGIISQFEGYEALRELNWEAYRERYGNIQRLDLILEGEGDSANHYRVSKQPDVLMLFYLFSAEELGELFQRLGYPWQREMIPRNTLYYSERSSHGSTLSRVVHAWVLARTDRPRALHFFSEALESDVRDIQEGTTAEGVHLGAMAGSIDLVERMSTGIETAHDRLAFNPELAEQLTRLDMRVHYRGHDLDVRLTRSELTIRSRNAGPAPIELDVRGERCQLECGTTRVFTLRERPGAAAARSHGR